jgi:hypothetical protein
VLGNKAERLWSVARPVVLRLHFVIFLCRINKLSWYTVRYDHEADHCQNLSLPDYTSRITIINVKSVTWILFYWVINAPVWLSHSFCIKDSCGNESGRPSRFDDSGASARRKPGKAACPRGRNLSFRRHIADCRSGRYGVFLQ